MSGWQNEPFPVEVKSGETKAFCMCGLSKSGPFCDGTHGKENTKATPQVETFDKDKTLYVCGCGQSANRPYCDGSHKSINDK